MKSYQKLIHLCSSSLSQVFNLIIIRNVPKFTNFNKPAARRFITLIDTLYDYKVRVLFSSEYHYKQLFEFADNLDAVADEHRSLMDDLGIKLGSVSIALLMNLISIRLFTQWLTTSDSEKQEDSKASIFSGQEEIFAFDRTLSRIAEMQTPAYWNQRETGDWWINLMDQLSWLQFRCKFVFITKLFFSV